MPQMMEVPNKADHDLLVRIDANLSSLMKRMDNLDPVIADLQTDRTQNQVHIANLQADVHSLEVKSNLWDTLNSLGGGVLALVTAYLGITRQ